ncbi:MAG: hypothetical protein AAF694_07670 [Bacteroidota bacterium]
MNLSFQFQRSSNFVLLVLLALGLTILSYLIRYSSQQASMAIFSYEELLLQEDPDALKEPFVLFPGPNTNTFILKKKQSGFIHLTNPSGTLERKFWMQEGVNHLDFSSIPPGVYMCWAVEWNHRKVEKVIVL